jgi:hypothetical protein
MPFEDADVSDGPRLQKILLTHYVVPGGGSILDNPQMLELSRKIARGQVDFSDSDSDEEVAGRANALMDAFALTAGQDEADEAEDVSSNFVAAFDMLERDGNVDDI